MLEVSEIFSSIQGEGPYMGQPAVFLRLAGCVEPFCAGCDTPYALQKGQPFSIADVKDAIMKHPAALVVITGGEPFLQWHQGLDALVPALRDTGRQIQFETSGKAGVPPSCGGMVVCSPKPMQQPVLAGELVARVDAFKFVVENAIEPVLKFQQQHRIASERIWLMPWGATRAQQLAGMSRVWDFCVAQGFRFSARLHILAYDDRPGV